MSVEVPLSIGGVRVANDISGAPPFGHTTHLRVFIDPDLLQYDEVWAAPGTWHDVIGVELRMLMDTSEGLVVEIRRV